MIWNWASFLIAFFAVTWAWWSTYWIEQRRFKRNVAAIVSAANDHPEKALELIHMLGEAYGVDTEK